MNRGVAVACLVLAACGAKTGIETPPTCRIDADCPLPDDVCALGVVCRAGFCAVAPGLDCADDTICTDDACDPGLASCLHPIRDRDGDGFRDGSCGDDDCDDLDPAVHPGARERCTGGADDDCDGTFDCSDVDCAGDPACAACAPEVCTGGDDEDCDGAVDCGDRDCVCCTEREVDCTDARDEDCDGEVDCLDADCASEPTCCLPQPETCDGLDQDCDGAPDDGVTCFFLDGAPLEAIDTSLCVGAFYSYDSPDRASASPSPDLRRSGAVSVAVVRSPPSCGGPGLVVVADTVRDGSGGALTLDATIDGGAPVAQSDDPRECVETGRGVSCTWSWEPCCTDGVAIGPLAADFCASVVLASPEGVSSIAVFDGPSRTRPRSFGDTFEICAVTIPSR